MAQHKVPQDVEADDKLLGPFTFRQFVYLLITVGSAALAVALFQIFPLLAILPVPFVLFFGILAVPLRRDQPMETYLAAVVSFYLKPRRRVWMPGQRESTIVITAPKVVEQPRTRNLSEEEASRRLSFLADIVDSEGLSIRNGATYDIDNSVSSNIQDDIIAEVNSAPDMLDAYSSSNINRMIENRQTDRRTQLLNQMKSTIEQAENPTPSPQPSQLPPPQNPYQQPNSQPLPPPQQTQQSQPLPQPQPTPPQPSTPLQSPEPTPPSSSFQPLELQPASTMPVSTTPQPTLPPQPITLVSPVPTPIQPLPASQTPAPEPPLTSQPTSEPILQSAPSPISVTPTPAPEATTSPAPIPAPQTPTPESTPQTPPPATTSPTTESAASYHARQLAEMRDLVQKTEAAHNYNTPISIDHNHIDYTPSDTPTGPDYSSAMEAILHPQSLPTPSTPAPQSTSSQTAPAQPTPTQLNSPQFAQAYSTPPAGTYPTQLAAPTQPYPAQPYQPVQPLPTPTLQTSAEPLLSTEPQPTPPPARTVPSARFVNLASNQDYTIETIQKEANRIKKADEETQEVFISLH